MWLAKSSAAGTAAMVVVMMAAACAQIAPSLQVAESGACLRCHAQPSRKFHADPTHKKFDCSTCHADGAKHVADTKTKPKLVQDETLCSSCHALKKRS